MREILEGLCDLHIVQVCRLVVVLRFTCSALRDQLQAFSIAALEAVGQGEIGVA